MKDTLLVKASTKDTFIEVETTIVATQVEPPVDNQPPVVSAGSNKTITLPTNSVILNGTASDPDGTIASYKWERVSGSGTILESNQAVTTITGLTEGTSVFKLTVTDNKGLTASSTTTIITNPEVVVPPDPGVPAGYTKIYSNGYDSSSDINSNQLGSGSISTTVKKTGAGSFKSQVNAGSGQISGGWRSEQQYSGSLSPNGADLIVEYDEQFETLPGVGGLTCQWHGNTQGTSGQLSLWYGDGQFMVMRNTIGTSGSSNIYQSKAADGGALWKVQLAKWYHFKWEIKFSSGNDGYVRLYIDGVLYYDAFPSGTKTGKTSDGSGQYFKPGQNLFASPKRNSILYIDNLNIYKKS